MSNPFIGEYLEQYFDELEPLQFYREIFPAGQLGNSFEDPVGRYHATLIDKNIDQDHRRYGFVWDDLEPIRKAVQEKRDAILAPVQYHGIRRLDQNARRLNAVTFDWDGITEEKYLRNFFHQVEYGHFPEPTYLIFSGNGCHLYYLLTEPIRCRREDLDRMRKFKRAFTEKLCSPYLTVIKKPQHEAVTQAMRLVGGATKDGGRVRAFRVGEPISIQDLSSYTDVPVDPEGKKLIPLSVARLRWPEWYERRIIRGEPAKGGYVCNRGLYDWWKEQIETGATYGHRYFCIMALAIFAVKSGVTYEELEKDAYSLKSYLSGLSADPFTDEDIEAALKAYDTKNRQWSRIAIEKNTGILIPPQRRNGRRQKDHLAIARAAKTELKKRNALKSPEGRPSKAGVVAEWRAAHPEGRKAECIRETGLGKATVYRHWDSAADQKRILLPEFQNLHDLGVWLDTVPEEVQTAWFDKYSDVVEEWIRNREKDPQK